MRTRQPFCQTSPRSPISQGETKSRGRGASLCPCEICCGIRWTGLAFFTPPRNFFGFVCASRPWPVKRRDPFRVGGGGACPSTSLGPIRLGDSGPECLCVRHRKRHIFGPFFAECPGVLVSVPCAHAQRRHARKRKFPECHGPTRVTAGSDFIFFQTGGSCPKNQHPATDFRKQSAIFQRFGAAVLWGYYTASNRCLKSLCGLFLFPSERRY